MCAVEELQLSPQLDGGSVEQQYDNVRTIVGNARRITEQERLDLINWFNFANAQRR
jgi:hypothetical protein